MQGNCNLTAGRRQMKDAGVQLKLRDGVRGWSDLACIGLNAKGNLSLAGARANSLNGVTPLRRDKRRELGLILWPGQRDDEVVKGNERLEVVCLHKARRQRDKRRRESRKQRGFLEWTALQRGLHRSCIARLARLVRQRRRELQRRNHDANVSILQAAKRPTQRRLGRQRCARGKNRLPDARIRTAKETRKEGLPLGCSALGTPEHIGLKDGLLRLRDLLKATGIHPRRPTATQIHQARGCAMQQALVTGDGLARVGGTRVKRDGKGIDRRGAGNSARGIQASKKDMERAAGRGRSLRPPMRDQLVERLKQERLTRMRLQERTKRLHSHTPFGVTAQRDERRL
jgi:hypothetical protein